MALKTYDMICIFPTSLSEDALGAVLTRIDDEIGKLGGTVQSKQPRGERVFARQMQKRDAGLYMTMRCELPPERIDAILARLKLVDDLFRVQILVANFKEEAVEEEEAPAEAPAEERTTDG